MELFKTSKKQPIKLRNFKFIGYHSDYTNCAYYYKDIGKDNFELMEMMLEGEKKPEIGAGTKVQVIDTFMSHHLKLDKPYKTTKLFVEHVVKKVYSDLKKEVRENMIKRFSSSVPKEIKEKGTLYSKYIDKGYSVLYCSNDESKERVMGIVNIVLVKDEHLKSEDPRIDIDRKYTLFKPLKYMTTPDYIKGTSKNKYFEEDLPQIVVNHDLLNK